MSDPDVENHQQTKPGKNADQQSLPEHPSFQSATDHGQEQHIAAETGRRRLRKTTQAQRENACSQAKRRRVPLELLPSTKDQTICKKSEVLEMQRRLSMFYKHLNQRHPIMKGLSNYTHFTTDLTEMYTELKLLKEEESMWKGATSVSLLEALKGTEKNVLFTGTAGVGKSSVILQVTMLWSEYLEKQGKELEGTFDSMEMLVLLRPSHCKDSLNDSVKEALRLSCGEEHLEGLMDFFNTNKEGTTIIIESLDEIYHLEELIKDVEREMRNLRRTFIIAARSNHPATERFSDMVSLRRVNVLGFDNSKILEFINKFLSMKPASSRKLQDIVSTDVKFKGLLHNPLILVLVCVLISQKSVDVETLTGFTKFQIFEAVEDLLTRRENIDPVHMKQFHELMLISVLDEAIIYRSNLDKICPQLVNFPYFCAENIQDPLKAWQGQVMFWSHEAFLEYGAARALSKCAVRNRLLTLITSKRNLNYVLEFTLGKLQLSKSEIKGIINTIQVTQLKTESNENTSGEECLCRKNGQIRDGLDQLTASLILQEESTSMDDDFTSIIPCRDCLKASGILAHSDNKVVLTNCFEVLHHLQEESYDVFQETINQVLPTTRYTFVSYKHVIHLLRFAKGSS